jgi:putative transposase
MARLPRFVIPGHPQHVIVRGNNRDPIFHGDVDRFYYLAKLKQACDKHECDLHAYVLMSNHVHLLLTPRHAYSIGKTMQMLGRYYVQYFNYNYNRTGTLWEGRYKATLIDSERYLLTCYRYIELNPVRANMVEHPSEYPWSSYRYNALGEDNNNLKPHQLYLRLSEVLAGRQAAYRELFKVQIEDRTLDELRDATNKAWVLGSGNFKQAIEKQLNRRMEPKRRGGDHKSTRYQQKVAIKGV